MKRGGVAERATIVLDRIRAHDATLRCYVAIDRRRVLDEAARLDLVPPHERGPLHGWLLAVKDIIDVAGMATRAGSSFYQHDATQDAPTVAALRAAGALVVGKTNTHEFAWGITTENPHFGRTANPWDVRRTAGGSSGGSGAAVAAGLADIALGTDTLGSIRIPAALNGISGLRPATGALSLDGVFPLAPGLDTIGPFARDIQRVHRVYEILAGAPVRGTIPLRAARLRGGGWERIDDATARALDAAAELLGAHGCAVVDVDWWDDALAPAVAVVQQRGAARVHASLFADHAEQYGVDVRARVQRSLNVGESDELRASATIVRSREGFEAATARFAVAIAPVTGEPAPLAPVPAAFREETIPLVTPASAFGLPAAAVPIGSTDDGLPLGMQIVALDGNAATALAVGRRFQELCEWHQRTPSLAK